MSDQLKYTVTAKDEGRTINVAHDLSKSSAEKLAREWTTEYPQCQVYVSWFRPSDGQHGYINPGGDHAITGKAW